MDMLKILHPHGVLIVLFVRQDDLANEAADAIRAVRGSDYEVGSSTNVLCKSFVCSSHSFVSRVVTCLLFLSSDAAAGGSDDYAKGVLGAKYSYTVEVVGGGSQGFDLPASQILNVVSETWEGIVVFARQVART